jgi:hypothetical protein
MSPHLTSRYQLTQFGIIVKHEKSITECPHEELVLALPRTRHFLIVDRYVVFVLLCVQHEDRNVLIVGC